MVCNTEQTQQNTPFQNPLITNFIIDKKRKTFNNKSKYARDEGVIKKKIRKSSKYRMKKIKKNQKSLQFIDKCIKRNPNYRFHLMKFREFLQKELK